MTPTLEGVTFNPPSVVDATVVAPSTNPPTLALAAARAPRLSVGETNGPAGTWTLDLSGSSANHTGWTTGSVVTITVAPPSGTNCQGNDYLYFSNRPTVTVVAHTGATAVPTFSTSLTGSGSCGSNEPDRLRISFTNGGSFRATPTSVIKLSITGVGYTVGATGSGVGAGPVGVQVGYSSGSSSFTQAGAANAEIGGMTVSADTPPVTVAPSAYDAPISSAVVNAAAPMTVPAGFLCLTLSNGGFDTASAAKVAVTSGDETVSPSASFQGTGPTGASSVLVTVTTGSTGAGGLSVTGLMVDAPALPGAVTITVAVGTSAICAHDTTPVGSATAYTVGKSTAVTQIYGPTPDATAAAELEHQFDAQGTACPGRSGARPVVLATDANYPDALSSAYLASSLKTGELLTPTGSLSAATVDAIRNEGITNVYVVGGPLAISTAVVSQLETTLAYNCGGTSPVTATNPVYLQVTRIYGQTQYGTAEWVAQFPTATNVGSLDVAGAYGATNRTGGLGRYNDTAGTASAAPSVSSSLPTAIVATGQTFQDAESASVLSYADRLPILLTKTTSLSPQVASTIASLQIKQVIVMGGPLAVTNAVVTALKALGVTVLRIAGQTDTDTAVQLANFEMASAVGHLGLGWAPTGRIAVARGNYYTDGLAGAVVAAGESHTRSAQPEPLLLTASPTTIGPYLTAFLQEAGVHGIDGMGADLVSGLTVLGGPDAVTPTQIHTMRTDL